MLRRLVLAVAGGLSLWLAFPAVDLWPLAPIGIALLVAAVRGASIPVATALGLLGGLCWFIPYVSWTGLHVGFLPWFALATLQALFIALWTGVLAGAHRRRPVGPLFIAISWTALEFARGSMPFGGFPWGRIAFSQADSTMLHLASLGGAALLGFGVALVGGLLLAVFDGLSGLQTPRQIAAPALAATAVLLVPLLIPAPTDGEPARLMAIQGNAPETGLDFNAVRREILDNHGRVTAQAAEEIHAGLRPAPDVVVWPENASDIDPFRHRDAGRVIDTSVDALGVPLLVGAVVTIDTGELLNQSIVYLPGQGATDQRYAKRELVPFAEYMPYREFFRAITRTVDLLERDFAPGHEVGLVRFDRADGESIVAGLGICFEVAIDHVMADTVSAGANLLVVQTNNAMFDRSAESAQQLAISRVRAVEYGRSVVHSSNVGISALITPDGVAHQKTELFVPAVIDGELPLRTDLTLAARLRSAPEWAAVGALAILLALRRPQRASKDAQDGR